MSALSSHLDRGWILAQAGDVEGAERAAREALGVDPESPEVYNLLGFIASLSGEPEAAVERYREALARNSRYFDAMLNAADVLLHPLHRFDEVLALCETAFEIAEGDDERTDALLLKMEALLAKGESNDIKSCLRRVPETSYLHEDYEFSLGRFLFEVGQYDKSEELIDRALSRDPENPNAHYFRGLLFDAKGDFVRAASSFVRVRVLEEQLAPEESELDLSLEDLEEGARNAIGKINSALRRFVLDAEVITTDFPGLEAVADGVNPHAPVLLDGFGTMEQPLPLCARVFVYRRNIENLIDSVDELEDFLVSTFEHEITEVFLEDHRTRPRQKHELN
jgi:tetratricopeptide (TPR) repeat protein